MTVKICNMQRFYLPTYTWEFPDFTTKDKDLLHQITRVLRMKIGEGCVFFGHDDIHEYEMELTNLEKKSASFRLIRSQEVAWREPNKRLTLYQASLNKWDKMEWVVQKWVELGVHEIVFFHAERSKRLEITDKKQSRLNAIAIEALEQCGGMRLPDIRYGEKLPEQLTWNTYFMHMGDAELWKVSSEEITLLIWPEGWWTDEEISSFQKKSYEPLQLWQRVLRAETAAIVWATKFLT